MTAYGQKARARRIAAGLCPYCGGSPEAGRRACPHCLARNREKNRRYHQRQRKDEPPYRGRIIALAHCDMCAGTADIRRRDDNHESACPCGWTRITVETGSDHA